MFKNNVEDEVDFCEAYKSQILNNDVEEKSSPIVSILIILFLLAIIITLSIFGYNYIMESKESKLTSPMSGKFIADEELKVTREESSPAHVKKEPKRENVKKMVVKSLNELPQSKAVDRVVDINDLADKVKIDMSESETPSDSLKDREQKENSIPPLSIESSSHKYVEDLAKDKPISPIVTDSKESNYAKALTELTKEIDEEGN